MPPLVVEYLPNWTTHTRVLKEKLGRPANVRPYGKGVRFLPKDEDEYRIVQRYLHDLEDKEGVAWFSYQLPAERNHKIAIRGLPIDTPTLELEEELRQHGLEPVFTRSIQGRNGRPGSIIFVELQGRKIDPKMYEITELLSMPGIIIEPWRGKRRPAQCHRCQLFRHSSHNCHRPLACVRCGANHAAKDCPRPREVPATCANCGGEHPANHSKCPVFRRELRNRRAGTLAKTESNPRTTQPPPPVQEPLDNEMMQKGSLMAAANPPTSRTATQSSARRRGKRRRKRKQVEVEGPLPPHTNPPATSEAPTERRPMDQQRTKTAPTEQDIQKTLSRFTDLANEAHQIGATDNQIRFTLLHLLKQLDTTTQRNEAQNTPSEPQPATY